MSFPFVYFFIVLKFLTLVICIQDEEIGELCFVTLVYRHGDRAPEGSYPLDPYSNVSCWPNGWGQLTKLGKLQQYELGQWIRQRYCYFLSENYNASDIYVRSTDVDRCLVSAYCNLAGLYENWNDGGTEVLGWRPIPVHTMPVTMDYVLASRKHCPVYEKLFKEMIKSEEVSLAIEHYEDFFCNLSRETGLKVKSLRDCVYLYSILNIQNMHSFQLPEWTKGYYPEPLKEIAEFSFKLHCFSTPLKRLKSGPLLKEIVQNMENKICGKITQKIWMYSAHDTTLANLMQCLNVYDGVIPPYTATLIFELFRVDDNYYVTVSYKTLTTCRVLRLPCCERVCPFECFKKIIKPVLPIDWEEECKER